MFIKFLTFHLSHMIRFAVDKCHYFVFQTLTNVPAIHVQMAEPVMMLSIAIAVFVLMDIQAPSVKQVFTTFYSVYNPYQNIFATGIVAEYFLRWHSGVIQMFSTSLDFCFLISNVI